jgi:hypothetical protein
MANRYWVGANNANWNATSSWSATSGGSSGASVPTTADDVFFVNTVLGATLRNTTSTAAGNCRNLTTSGNVDTAYYNINLSGFALTIQGSVTLTNTYITSTTVNFTGTATQTVIWTSPVQTSTCNIVINKTAGAVNWSTSGTLGSFTLTAGTFNLAAQYLGFTNFLRLYSSFSATGTAVRALNLGDAVDGAYFDMENSTGSFTIANMTNYTSSGIGGFQTRLNVARSYTVGTTGGNIDNAPRISMGIGNSLPSFPTGSYYKSLTHTSGTTVQNIAATTINVGSFETSATAGQSFGLVTMNVITTGTLSLNGRSIAALTINHTGTTTLLSNGTVTGTTTLTQGALDLGGFNLTTGIFSSSSSVNVRSVAFGASNIILNSSTAGATVLSVTESSSFSCTFSTGGFSTDGAVARTITYVSAAATGGDVFNLSVTSGASTITITEKSRFNTLNFTGFSGSIDSGVPTWGIRVNTLVLSAGGTFTSFVPVFTTAQTWTAQFSKQLGGIGNAITGGLALTLDGTQTFTTNSYYILYQGVLDLGGFDLTIGQISQPAANTAKVIAFGSNDIILSGTVAASTAISLAGVANLSWTGTGGFVSAATVARTFTFGTTDGTSAKAINLRLTGLGTAVQTFTSGSWFNNLNLGATGFNPGTTTINVNSVTLSVGGSFNATTFIMVGSGTIASNGATNLLNLIINHAGTTTLGSNLSLLGITNSGTTTLTTGTLDLNGFNLTTGIFSSSTSNARSVLFGSNYIFLNHGTASTVVLDINIATNFTWTGVGGFSTAMGVARTVNFGGASNSGGLALTAGPNMFVTSGASTLSYGASSSFNQLNFTGSTCTSSGQVFVDTLTLATGGTYTALSPVFTRTQTWTAQFSKQLGGIGVSVLGGTLTLDGTQTYSATATAYVYAGTLDLGGFDLTIGTLLGSVTNTRAIVFGANNIILSTTSGGATNLNFAIATDFTWTGTGGFTAAADITRTFTFGTTGGTATNAPNLTLTGSGTAIQTLTTGGWFKNLDFGTTAFTLPSTSLSIAGNLTLSASGTYIAGVSGLNVTTVGTSVITANGKTIATLIINCPGGTTTLNGPLTYVVAATVTTTLTAGTLDLNGNDHTTLVFSSNNTNVRSVAFGANKINITSTSSGVNALVMADVTNFTYTGTGQFSAAADVARIYTFGSTAGATSTNIPNLQFTGTGALAQTFGSASNFNTLDFGTTTSNPSTGNVRVRSLILSATGAYSAFQLTMAYSGGSLDGQGRTISSLTINVPGGTTTLASSLIVTAATTLTAGTFDLNDFNLSTGIFSSSNTNVRSINFRSIEVPLTSATTAATVVSIADATNFTCEGAGGFTAEMPVTRTFTVGTTAGGSLAGAPNLSIKAGASTPTITTGGWFKTLSFELFTGSLGTTNLNLTNLVMPNSGVGTFGSLTATMRSTGSITPNGRQFGAIFINHSGTTTLAGNTSLALSTSYTNTAGTLDFAGFNLTCTGTANYTAGTLSNIGTLQCTAFTASGNFSLTNGNLTCTSFVCVGGFTYAATAGTFSNTGQFTHTSGNVTFSKAFSMTGTYTLTAGTLTLDGVNLTVGIFSSSNVNTRSIAFSSNYIFLTTTTASVANLSVANSTGFSASGTGGFSADASIARIYTFGTTAAPSSTNVAPNLFIQNVGTSLQTITSNSYFNLLSILPTVTFATTTVNLNSLTLSDTVVTNSMAVNCLGTGTLNIGLNRTISNLTINHTGTTTVSGSAFIVSSGGVTTLTQGTLTLDTAGFSTGYFSSLSVANIRAVNFGSNFIDLTNPLSAQINLIMSTAANFSASGTGGFRAAMSISRTFQCGNISAPTAAPNLFIASGTSIPTFTTGGYFGNLDFTGSTCIPATTSLNLTGFVLASGGTYTGLTATMVGSGTINGNGKTIPALTVNHATLPSTTTFAGNLTNSVSTTLTQGTIDLAGNTLTTADFTSSGSAVRTITSSAGLGTMSISQAWNVSTPASNFTGSNYSIRMTSALGKNFNGGGGGYGNLVQAGAGLLFIGGSNSFADIQATTRPSTISFQAGSIQTLSNFTLSGTAGNLVTINSFTPGTQFTMTKPSGTVVVDYLNIQDSNVTGGAYWTTTTSNFISNNSGWNVVPSGVTITGQFFAFF